MKIFFKNFFWKTNFFQFFCYLQIKGIVNIKSHVISIVYIEGSSSRYFIVSVIQPHISPEADILAGIKVLNLLNPRSQLDNMPTEY